jgi:hypothetical protein
LILERERKGFSICHQDMGKQSKFISFTMEATAAVLVLFMGSAATGKLFIAENKNLPCTREILREGKVA